MYESHYTHHFFRLWGIKEGATGTQPSTVLLGNSQNDFDAKLGDVAAVANSRFFLIEFKLRRKGIGDEVGKGGKVHRQFLYEHLKSRKECRHLSVTGHYAAYGDVTNRLAFEPYVVAASEELILTIDKAAQAKGSPLPARNFKNKAKDFDGFYGSVMDERLERDPANPAAYLHGGGLPWEGFKAYIDCMYKHLVRGANAKGKAVLGVTDPETKKFIVFTGSVADLIQKLDKTLTDLRRTMAQSSPPPTSTSHAPAANPQAAAGNPQPSGGTQQSPVDNPKALPGSRLSPADTVESPNNTSDPLDDIWTPGGMGQ